MDPLFIVEACLLISFLLVILYIMLFFKRQWKGEQFWLERIQSERRGDYSNFFLNGSSYDSVLLCWPSLLYLLHTVVVNGKAEE